MRLGVHYQKDSRIVGYLEVQNECHLLLSALPPFHDI
jgi:hypothetical protein